IRLGRFKETVTKRLKSTTIDGKSAKLYKTVKGNLSFAVNNFVDQTTKIQVDYLKSETDSIRFGGKLFTRTNQVEQINLLLIGRENNSETRLPVQLNHLKEATEKRFGLNR